MDDRDALDDFINTYQGKDIESGAASDDPFTEQAISGDVSNALNDDVDQVGKRFGTSSFAPMRGKRTFEGIPMLEESELENSILGERQRRFGKTSFFAGRGKRLADLEDIVQNRERRFSPRTFIGIRGKRMLPFTMGQKYQRTLGKILRAAAELKSMKSNGE